MLKDTSVASVKPNAKPHGHASSALAAASMSYKFEGTNEAAGC
jgi:hypothetical protein